jgi:hypothetical protein
MNQIMNEYWESVTPQQLIEDSHKAGIKLSSKMKLFHCVMGKFNGHVVAETVEEARRKFREPFIEAGVWVSSVKCTEISEVDGYQVFMIRNENT